MGNVRMMYVRPGNLFKEFTVEHNVPTVTGTGRVANSYCGGGAETLKGCLAGATDEDRANHNQKNHIVTHTIVQAGLPKANRGDKLVLGERIFYIVDVDSGGSLGISTIYYAEERKDVR